VYLDEIGLGLGLVAEEVSAFDELLASREELRVTGPAGVLIVVEVVVSVEPVEDDEVEEEVDEDDDDENGNLTDASSIARIRSRASFSLE